MVLDTLIQRWCIDAYAPDDKTQFNRYAEYVARDPWIKGMERHRLLLWPVFLVLVYEYAASEAIVDFHTFVVAASLTLLYLGSMTLTFLIYGLKKYNLQDGTTFVFYIMMLLVISNTCMRLPEFVQIIFGIVMLPVSFLVHHWIPMRHRALRRSMKRFHAQQMKEAEDLYKQRERDEFDRWNTQQTVTAPNKTASGERVSKYAVSMDHAEEETRARLTVLPEGYSASYEDEYEDDLDEFDDELDDEFDFDDDDELDFDDETDDEFDFDDGDEPEDVTPSYNFDNFDDMDALAKQLNNDYAAVFDAYAKNEAAEQFAGFDPAEACAGDEAENARIATDSDDEEDPYNDPAYAEDVARYLLEGFASDPKQLKQRYRELAREYHPDNGGSNQLMQAINVVYDELCAQLK